MQITCVISTATKQTLKKYQFSLTHLPFQRNAEGLPQNVMHNSRGAYLHLSLYNWVQQKKYKAKN